MIEVQQKIVKAEIINHQQNLQEEPKAEEKLEKAKKSKCVIF